MSKIKKAFDLVFDKKMRFNFLAYKTAFYNSMSDRDYLCKMYRIKFDKELNLDNPVLFSEKIQWLKLNDRNPLYTTMVDKYDAKRYVADLIGEEYVTKTLGVWKRFDDIDFQKLPQKFVLKCTHDSGGLIVCTDKSKLDISAAKKKIESCMKRNYYWSSREWPYKNVCPRIIAEEYMENGESGLFDYKIWCFNGVPQYTQFITGRLGDTTYEGFYDREWNLQPFNYHNKLIKCEIAKPEKIDEVWLLAEKLAKNTRFSRCDFYILENGDIRFGEITFFPMSGMEKWHPEEMNIKMGEMIDLFS